MTHPGEPGVLKEQETKKPTLNGPDDMLVRLRAAGVNPIDTKLRARGTYFPDRMPAILGCDGAGIVEMVGESVERFQVGDAVYFCHGGIGAHPGNYAQYTTINQYYAARMPENLDFVQAAAVPLVLITAWESLYERVQLGREQHVLIHGGTGGVGHIALQLARLRNARVMATVGTQEGASWLRDMGAQAVLYREHDFVDAVKNWTGNAAGVDIALDTVGGDVFVRTCAAVRDYGDLVTLLAPPENMDWREARVRNLRISLELMLTPMLKQLDKQLRRHAQILREATRLFESGKLQISVHEVLPLAEAARAHHMQEQGGVLGKLVLVID